MSTIANTIAIPKLIFGTSSLGNLYEDIGIDRKRAVITAAIQASKERGLVCMFDSAGKYGGKSCDMGLLVLFC